jgi:hypothetical protein
MSKFFDGARGSVVCLKMSPASQPLEDEDDDEHEDENPRKTKPG